MSVWGVIFMAFSWGMIVFLAIYSFARVLRDK
jgi:hypothetical protein